MRRVFKPTVKAALPTNMHGLRSHALRHTAAARASTAVGLPRRWPMPRAIGLVWTTGGWSARIRTSTRSSSAKRTARRSTQRRDTTARLRRYVAGPPRSARWEGGSCFGLKLPSPAPVAMMGRMLFAEHSRAESRSNIL